MIQRAKPWLRVVLPLCTVAIAATSGALWHSHGAVAHGGLRDQDVAAATMDAPGPPLPAGMAAVLSSLAPLDLRPPLAVPPARPTPLRPVSGHTDHTVIAKGGTLGTALMAVGVLAPDRAGMTAALKAVGDQARRVVPGTTVTAWFDGTAADHVQQVTLTDGSLERVVITRDHRDEWHAAFEALPITRERIAFVGRVRSTLWRSAVDAGMDPSLIGHLTSVFAWQLDFNREVQEGDRWRFSIERQTYEGQVVGYGDILAAEYVRAAADGTDGATLTAVRFVDQEGRSRYFDRDGQALERRFRRSPLNYGHITSGFTTRRYHPILKVNKPHLGIDYGAPQGTPVMAVADGSVTAAGPNGPSGISINIRHDGVYSTAYKHLSRIDRSVATGRRVTMGQVIGYVGATGLATGPHLHYELHVGNRVVDPQSVPLPAGTPLPPPQLPAFKLASNRALSRLPAWDLELATAGPKAERVSASE